MYKSILIVLFILTYNFAYSQYNIEGKIDEKHNGLSVYLSKLDKNKKDLEKIDSTYINNGKFTFSEKNSDSLDLRFIQIPDIENTNPVLFIVEKGKITVDYKHEKPQIIGLEKNKELKDLLNKQDIILQEIESLLKNNASNLTKEDTILIEDKIDSLYQKISDDRYEFISNNIDNNVGEFLFLSSLEILPAQSIISLLSQTRMNFKNSTLAQDIKNYYTPSLALSRGSDYTELTLKDMQGNTVNLSNFIDKDKITLLDFWASWCGPCLREMPVLKQIYNEYKDLGFQIIGISLDDKHASWVNTIKRMNLTWPQISDLKGWQSIVVDKYGINTIPTTLLLGKEGKIIANNIKGERLRQALNKLLNN